MKQKCKISTFERNKIKMFRVYKNKIRTSNNCTENFKQTLSDFTITRSDFVQSQEYTIFCFFCFCQPKMYHGTTIVCSKWSVHVSGTLILEYKVDVFYDGWNFAYSDFPEKSVCATGDLGRAPPCEIS